MITSLKQAHTVQARRVVAKKRGYSKAVRTFLKKECTEINGNSATFDPQEYMRIRDLLPVSWIFQKSK